MSTTSPQATITLTFVVNINPTEPDWADTLNKALEEIQSVPLKSHSVSLVLPNEVYANYHNNDCRAWVASNQHHS